MMKWQQVEELPQTNGANLISNQQQNGQQQQQQQQQSSTSDNNSSFYSSRMSYILIIFVAVVGFILICLWLFIWSNSTTIENDCSLIKTNPFIEVGDNSIKNVISDDNRAIVSFYGFLIPTLVDNYDSDTTKDDNDDGNLKFVTQLDINSINYDYSLSTLNLNFSCINSKKPSETFLNMTMFFNSIENNIEVSKIDVNFKNISKTLEINETKCEISQFSLKKLSIQRTNHFMCKKVQIFPCLSMNDNIRRTVATFSFNAFGFEIDGDMNEISLNRNYSKPEQKCPEDRNILSNEDDKILVSKLEYPIDFIASAI